jgi:hypothetical protein
MLGCKALRLLWGLSLVSGFVYAQCYDLTSVQLYELKGRFQERWDKPIWNAKPGEGNFNLDESPWFGGIAEFVLFAVGRVQKTESGWVPLNKAKTHEVVCAMTPERSDIHCTWAPFQTPFANSRQLPPRERDQETWTLTRDGLLRFVVVSSGARPSVHADALTETLIHLVNQNEDLGSTFEAVLDLNTGAYSAVAHTHSKGDYRRHFPDGVELWRDTTFTAKARLTPQPCTASIQKAALKTELQDDKTPPVPICAARQKVEGGKPTFEFIINPRSAASPEGCIVAYEGPMPLQSSRPAIAPEQR